MFTGGQACGILDDNRACTLEDPLLAAIHTTRTLLGHRAEHAVLIGGTVPGLIEDLSLQNAPGHGGVQYNDDTRDVGTNVRIGWLDTAGTGLFLVWNDTNHTGSLERTGILAVPKQRQLVVKYGLTPFRWTVESGGFPG